MPPKEGGGIHYGNLALHKIKIPVRGYQALKPPV